MLQQTLQAKKSVDDIWPVTGRKVLIRVDFNLSIRDGVIINDYHIRTAIPSIRRIIDQGGICILLSHLGRPKGVDSDRVDFAHDKKKMMHFFDDNRGKTSFFASLPNEDKLTILSWSTKKDKMDFSTVDSKTAVFAKLSDEEKKELLHRFLSENKERMFSQLTNSAGFEEEFSLQVVAERLAELLGQHVYFAHDCLRAKQEVMRLRCGEVMLLENLRFYADENSASAEKRSRMAHILASYGDIFVNDAFGCCSREAASITDLALIMGNGAAGYLMEREISFFAKLLNNPSRPLVAIIGGGKFSDKICLLENMLNRIDKLIIGGGMAYAFLKAKGFAIGKSMCENAHVSIAEQVLKTAKKRKVEVYLPLDHVCHHCVENTDRPLITSGVDIPEGYIGLDIGPKTIQLYAKVISECKSAVWNGPVGVFELKCFTRGTFAIARVMSECTQKNGLFSIVGGGDSATAAELSGEAPLLSHVSTGGLASLELLEGKIIPGIAVLDDKE